MPAVSSKNNLFAAVLAELAPRFILLDSNGRLVLSAGGVFDLFPASLRSGEIEAAKIFDCLRGTEPGAAPCTCDELFQRGRWLGAVLIAADGEAKASYLDGRCLRDDLGNPLGYLLLFEPPDVGGGDGERQQQKLELLGTLAGGIAHDLNNILTSVLGHVSYLRLASEENPGTRESLAAVEDGARKAAAITNHILDFARGEPLKKRQVNLSLVVASGVNLMRGALPKNVLISVAEEMEDVHVFGDENQLAQIFMNLAVNAADALPRGGRIIVDLEHVVLCNEPKLADGEYAKLVIRDNGTGMSAEVKDRIFEPFFTTKKRRGTGLGLANVFSLVRLHNGKIEVQSAPGSGSVFEVFLPLSPQEERPIERAKPIPPKGGPVGGVGSREGILVVEDEEIVRTVIQKSLEHLGYRVEVAESGREGIEKYAQNPESFQLVILDMMMPQMSGDEVFVRLKKVNPNVKVLIASGYSSDVRARNVLERGGLGLIQKPFAVEELAREVRRCLDLKRDPVKSS